VSEKRGSKFGRCEFRDVCAVTEGERERKNRQSPNTASRRGEEIKKNSSLSLERGGGEKKERGGE